MTLPPLVAVSGTKVALSKLGQILCSRLRSDDEGGRIGRATGVIPISCTNQRRCKLSGCNSARFASRIIVTGADNARLDVFHLNQRKTLTGVDATRRGGHAEKEEVYAGLSPKNKKPHG